MSAMSTIYTLESEITTAEYLRLCCKVRYRPRVLNNKGAILVLVWCFLIFFMINYSIRKAVETQGYLAYALVLAIVGILLPVAGWLADVRFGRYKVICWSMWTMWISAMLLAIGYVVVNAMNFKFQNDHTYKKIAIALIALIAIGVGGFLANIIQFGVDQLPDASTTEITSFIAWCAWTIVGSKFIVFLLTCLCENYWLIGLLLVCVSLSLVVSSNFIFKHYLIKEPITQNPFSLIFKVVRYAIRNKRPRQRSAFTYYEDDLPSRIDFGKHKYGGPFTTEQVEDVKTFFNILAVAFITCIFMATRFDHHTFDLKMYLTRAYYSDVKKSDSKCQSFHQCFQQNFMYAFYCICTMTLIPLHELLIFPVFNRCIRLKSYLGVLLGMVLQLGGYIVLMILTTYSRKVLTDAGFPSNETTQCIFYESFNSINNTLDYRWYIISECLFAFSEICLLKGSLEFYCAQVPYSMKGLLAGFNYGLITLFASFNYGLIYIFEINFHTWEKQTILNCGFWYLLTKIIPGIILLLLSILAFKCYKKRKREDVLPNEHIFAEQYYSKTLSLTT